MNLLIKNILNLIVEGFIVIKTLFFAASPDRSGNPCGLGFSPQNCNGEQVPSFQKCLIFLLLKINSKVGVILWR